MGWERSQPAPNVLATQSSAVLHDLDLHFATQPLAVQMLARWAIWTFLVTIVLALVGYGLLYAVEGTERALGKLAASASDTQARRLAHLYVEATRASGRFLFWFGVLVMPSAPERPRWRQFANLYSWRRILVGTSLAAVVTTLAKTPRLTLSLIRTLVALTPMNIAIWTLVVWQSGYLPTLVHHLAQLATNQVSLASIFFYATALFAVMRALSPSSFNHADIGKSTAERCRSAWLETGPHISALRRSLTEIRENVLHDLFTLTHPDSLAAMAGVREVGWKDGSAQLQPTDPTLRLASNEGGLSGARRLIDPDVWSPRRAGRFQTEQLLAKHCHDIEECATRIGASLDSLKQAGLDEIAQAVLPASVRAYAEQLGTGQLGLRQARVIAAEFERVDSESVDPGGREGEPDLEAVREEVLREAHRRRRLLWDLDIAMYKLDLLSRAIRAMPQVSVFDRIAAIFGK